MARHPIRTVVLGIALLAIPWIFPQRYFLQVTCLGLIYAVLALGLQLLSDPPDNSPSATPRSMGRGRTLPPSSP